jgi:photosystem II stability/assembly factor-like uncharacterized protein
MSKIKLIFFNFLLMIVLFTATGCVVVSTGSTGVKSNNTGGIFVSNNKGDVWQNKSLIANTSGSPKSFSGLDVASLVMDPSDNKTIYFASVGNGLYYTYDSANSWQIMSSLGNSTVRAIAIDPKAKCNIYIAIANKAYKTIDCGRTWSQTYVDDPTVTVDALAVDQYNSSVIYASVSRGDLIRSNDQGSTWQTIYRVKDPIKKIVIDANDSRNLFLVTLKKGAFYSRDGGDTWSDFSKSLKDQKLSLNVIDVALVKSEPQVIFLVATDGILQSKDEGASWDKLGLIPPENKASINAFAVNPNDSKQVYYMTNSTFYNSQDGGQSWKPTKLPTDRAGVKLLLDPQNSNLIYLGARTLTKK